MAQSIVPATVEGSKRRKVVNGKGGTGHVQGHGESAEVEMTIEHYGQEPIEVGTRWFTDRSGGRFIQNVVTQVLERSRELRSVDTAETAFYVI